MHEINSRYQDSNGYILVFRPDHSRAFASGSFKGYVYEHILVAEEILGRPLFTGDEVHHLDFNKSNNSPNNLLIISGPMHVRLHAWLSNYQLIPSEEQQKKIDTGCVRCAFCSTPINYGDVYCSKEHANLALQRFNRPTKENLEQLIWEKPTTQLAKELGVSDSAIGKLCKSLGIEKPPRGYWTKKKFKLV